MRYLFIILAFLFIVVSCKSKSKNLELPSDSIFHLQSSWQNQTGDSLHLADLKGKTLVVVMIYTSCKAACPVLVSDMKKIAGKIDAKNLDDVSLVLVSIDPVTDTPEVLEKFAKTNSMTDSYWTFLRSDVAATQEFANVLSMKYKKISPMDFSHSNIISVFSPSGQLISQEEGLGIDTEKVASLVNETVKES